ncbi:DUF572-domain-containing protein [Eremomyces bilateralis CBS 781.70]|uniref:Splicing factor YJU2 n=1 Tax=Eremomyces bilateralis CBS 781.70 TaxID=1392243 RepID=A0A6G1G6D4_9PEZI|nr:DUF572-domain-containing protein [Eremomyces bilateralis CBS 781.70]KAF1813598.1 DUF572-domain-containing protein [Eremomyces bilateralis CBS 781.70]
MSERKVTSKYYPPDFDPSKLGRVRQRGPKGPKRIPVRLMAPFSMKCTRCSEYIYKGRKFNAQKETTDEKYYSIPIYRFYIRCTRCSSEITFKTDPKNMDYECEQGARRNFEPWREGKLAEETEEETLDRLEREEAERDPMKELEGKQVDAKTEMAIADALDEIRMRNARIEREGQGGTEAVQVVREQLDEEKKRQEMEDEEAARRAFARAGKTDENWDGGGILVDAMDMMDAIVEEVDGVGDAVSEAPAQEEKPIVEVVKPKPPVPEFKRIIKKKQKPLLAGIKGKQVANPLGIVGGDSDSD